MCICWSTATRIVPAEIQARDPPPYLLSSLYVRPTNYSTDRCLHCTAFTFQHKTLRDVKGLQRSHSYPANCQGKAFRRALSLPKHSKPARHWDRGVTLVEFLFVGYARARGGTTSSSTGCTIRASPSMSRLVDVPSTSPEGETLRTQPHFLNGNGKKPETSTCAKSFRAVLWPPNHEKMGEAGIRRQSQNAPSEDTEIPSFSFFECRVSRVVCRLSWLGSEQYSL